jgi:hypothetical protein
VRTEKLQLLLSKPGVFVSCAREAVGLLRRPALLSAYWPLLLLEAALLLALNEFPHGPIVGVLAALFRWVGGEAALHYPRALAVLPLVFRRGDLLLVFFVGSLCRAALIGLLPAAFMKEGVPWRSAAGAAWKLAPAIWLVSLPAALSRGLGFAVCDLLANGPLASSPDALWWVGKFVFVATTAVEALFCYAVPALLLGRLGSADALARTVSLASRNFWLTVGFMMFPSVLLAPVRMVENNLQSWFNVFAPERASVVVALAIVASLLGHFVRVAALTRFYLHWYGMEGKTQ